MKRKLFLIGLVIGAVTPAMAQTADVGSITLYELPAYLGRSVRITSATSNLATVGFANRAQSARVQGSWEVCPETAYKGSCQTLTASAKVLQLLGLGGKIASVRPTPVTTGQTITSSTAGTATASPGTKVNLADLDVDEGAEGQDTTFFARPSLQGNQVSAGTNDRAAADAFCKQAGQASSVYASRARTQLSNIVDVASATRVRGYPLRDVLCRK
jgi:hypothetical protein